MKPIGQTVQSVFVRTDMIVVDFFGLRSRHNLVWFFVLYSFSLSGFVHVQWYLSSPLVQLMKQHRGCVAYLVFFLFGLTVDIHQSACSIQMIKCYEFPKKPFVCRIHKCTKWPRSVRTAPFVRSSVMICFTFFVYCFMSFWCFCLMNMNTSYMQTRLLQIRNQFFRTN